MDLNQIVKDIEHILLTEQSSRITNRGDISTSELRRKELETLLQELYEPYERLSGQIRGLPDLPDEHLMNWAESILSMRNLVILVLDTTGTNEKSHDIIRIHARSIDSVLIDQLIRPTRQLHANTLYTGIEYISLQDAPTLPDAWEDSIKPALSGRFVVSYGLSWVEKMLNGNREHSGLSRLPFRGEDLMERAKSYFKVGYYDGLKLADAVERIGKPFPYSPPLAADRATGCLNLLLAMSNGVTSAKPQIDANTDLDEIKDHPF